MHAVVLTEVNRRVEARSKPFARALSAWLDRFARHELVRALANPEAYASTARVKKRDDETTVVRDLQQLLLLFGMRQAGDAADRTAGRPIIPARLFVDALEQKPVKIKWFWELEHGVAVRSERLVEETRNEARDSVKRIIRDSLAEYPRPSPGEIARRIRTAFNGPGDVERPHRVHGKEEDREFIFSSERAAIIARTELVQAENTGIMEGYRATGVEEIEWLAYGNDGKSGKRQHWKMKNVRVKVGEFFTLPSGAQLRYPGDPSGPISETIQCRCTIRSVLRKRG